MSDTRKTTNPVLLLFAIIGVCAVLYAAWRFYQGSTSENEARRRFAAPVSSGVPDLLHASPAASPLPP
jgi:hypothetical protein